MRKSLFLSLLLIAALLLGSVASYADKYFSSVEVNSAYGGASLILSDYLKENENGAAKIAAALKPLVELNEQEKNGETGEPISYLKPLVGIVCTVGNLNIRKSESVVSEIVARTWQKSEVYIYGEHIVNGHKWYKVRIDGADGYCMADYIRFGDAANEYFVELHEQEKQNAEMPVNFDLWDDITALDQSVQDKLVYYKKQINYSLKYDYPKAKQESQYLNEYSIMVYLLENYQHLADLATEYNLKDTNAQIAADIRTINLLRENLTDTTGTTSEEFQRKIAEAQEQARRNSVQGKGEQVAAFAASFVGKLNYVWGGASLVSGADCSGFAAQCYAHFGYLDQAACNRHAYVSGNMREIGYAVDVRNILPGDLICYNGHVSIYYGNGICVHSPNPGRKVEFGNYNMMPIITVRRLY